MLAPCKHSIFFAVMSFFFLWSSLLFFWQKQHLKQWWKWWESLNWICSTSRVTCRLVICFSRIFFVFRTQNTPDDCRKSQYIDVLLSQKYRLKNQQSGTCSDNKEGEIVDTFRRTMIYKRLEYIVCHHDGRMDGCPFCIALCLFPNRNHESLRWVGFFLLHIIATIGVEEQHQSGQD